VVGHSLEDRPVFVRTLFHSAPRPPGTVEDARVGRGFRLPTVFITFRGLQSHGHSLAVAGRFAA
jgi:hypothetical protein